MADLRTLIAKLASRFGYTGRHRAAAVEARRELSGTPYVPMDDLLSTE
ncbi:hypothetical protein Afil01_24490 [Actinorhabdospora filicis]|uniref:Uncharacterized protein n=1 Tax=Actinorhabdospora filicis TaxID=1785913 RepID=A0A9W6SKU5_9ACTN|nr:hypothetical protein [Actinorhabdospora filicis]GLZ77642.1 hypothetical protein Afil01_24490 [Actinorhabdospora filicis]